MRALARALTLCMALALTSAAANAQTHIHGYGGSLISSSNKGYSGFLAGGGVERKWFFVAADGHSLRTPPQVQTVLNLFEDLTGTNFGLGLELSGLDLSLGIPIRVSKTVSLIPAPIVGFTNIRFCIDTNCFSAPDLNYGGGGVARIMLAPRIGVHAGFRYTRHYELAFTAGAVFRLWD